MSYYKCLDYIEKNGWTDPPHKLSTAVMHRKGDYELFFDTSSQVELYKWQKNIFRKEVQVRVDQVFVTKLDDLVEFLAKHNLS